MTYLVKACTDSITNITGPLYHLARGDRNRFQETNKLLLATFRTATVAGFFFIIIPFNYIFGHRDNLSGSLAFTAQFLIHPYAAALFNASFNGRLLVMKVIDIFVKRELLLTRDDAAGFVRAIAFCYIAELVNPLFHDYALDKIYRKWSYSIANWLCP